MERWVKDNATRHGSKAGVPSFSSFFLRMFWRYATTFTIYSVILIARCQEIYHLTVSNLIFSPEITPSRSTQGYFHLSFGPCLFGISPELDSPSLVNPGSAHGYILQFLGKLHFNTMLHLEDVDFWSIQADVILSKHNFVNLLKYWDIFHGISSNVVDSIHYKLHIGFIEFRRITADIWLTKWQVQGIHSKD